MPCDVPRRGIEVYKKLTLTCVTSILKDAPLYWKRWFLSRK